MNRFAYWRRPKPELFEAQGRGSRKLRKLRSLFAVALNEQGHATCCHCDKRVEWQDASLVGMHRIAHKRCKEDQPAQPEAEK